MSKRHQNCISKNIQTVYTSTLQLWITGNTPALTCLSKRSLFRLYVIGYRIKLLTVYYHFVDRPTETQLSSSVAPVEEGKLLLITCTARANPSAEYKFYHDGKLVSSSSTGVLTFVSVKNEDQGTYRCVPYNQLGEGPEATVTVTVEGNQIYHEPVI